MVRREAVIWTFEDTRCASQGWTSLEYGIRSGTKTENRTYLYRKSMVQRGQLSSQNANPCRLGDSHQVMADFL
jgi:hypothetical protein